MSKRIVGFLLAFCVALTLLPIPALADEAAEVAQMENALERKEPGEPVAFAADEMDKEDGAFTVKMPEAEADEVRISVNTESGARVYAQWKDVDSDEEFAELMSTGGHTQAEAVAWAKAQKGESLDYDGYYNAQCVDLIAYYYKYLGTKTPGGDGRDYATNTLPSGWKRITYKTGVIPHPGDVAVWTDGSHGHVAIVLSADSDGMETMDQNIRGYYCAIENRTYTQRVPACFIRPDFEIDAPTIKKTTADSTTAIKVEWNTVSGADSYILSWRKAGENTEYTPIPDIKGASKTVSNLEPATRYFFRVKAVNGSGESGWSTTKYCYTNNEQPEVTRVSGSVSSLDLKWKKAQGAKTYEIYRKKYNGDYSKIKSVSNTTTSYTDTGLEAGTMYVYKVTAKCEWSNSSGGTDKANCESAEKTKYTHMTAPSLTVKGQTSIQIKWNKNYGNKEYAFHVFRNGADIATVPYSTTSYTDTGLSAGTTYEYQIKSYETNGSGTVDSLKASAMTSSPEPSKSVLDVNCSLDGEWLNSTEGIATFDMWINSTLPPERAKITDFWESLNVGDAYHVYTDNSYVQDGYLYLGCDGAPAYGVAGNSDFSVMRRFATARNLDVNCIVDGVWRGELTDVATFDITVEIDTPMDDVRMSGEQRTGQSDYYQKLPTGARYYITNIQPNSNYAYICADGGALEGVIDAREDKSDISVMLVFETAKKQVNVTFNANANDVTVTPGSKVVNVGDIYGELPAPTRSGYEFDGWYTDVRGGGYVNQDTVTKEADHTLYAHWFRRSEAPVGVTESNGRVYELFDKSLTWPEAKSFCEARGGHLVTITSQSEQELIENLIDDNYQGTMRQYWIGLTSESGTSKWVTGETFEYNHWAPGEPNNSSRENGQLENCAEIYNVPNFHDAEEYWFYWNDIFSDNIYPGEEFFFSTEYVGFICETESPSSAQITIDNKSVSSGSKFTVPILLKNNPGIAGFSFAIKYDAEKLEYLGAADGDFAGVADNVSVDGNQLGFAYASASGANLSGETIAKLTFQAKSGAKGTAKLLLVMDEDFGDSFRAFHSETQQIVSIDVNTQDGEITIADFIPGDVNDSGRVDNDDLILLTRYRARWKVTINMDAADVDGSGKVDNDDLILLTRYRARWKVTLLPGKVSSG